MRTLLLLAALLAAGSARAASPEEALLASLRSEDASVREQACAALGRASQRGPRVYPALALLMDRDLSDRVRLAAAEAVITYPGDDPLAKARAFLGSEPGDQARIAFTLDLSTEPAHLQDAGATELIGAILSDDPGSNVRLAAAGALGRRGDPRALPALKRASLNDGEKQVRAAAKQAALALLAPRAAPKSARPSKRTPKPGAVKGKDSCPEPWGWCECNGPIKRAAKCLERADCRVEIDTMLQLGMPCLWNGAPIGTPN